jgi:hypothetical protein
MTGVKEAAKKPAEQKVRTNRILAVDFLIRVESSPGTMARRPGGFKP